MQNQHLKRDKIIRLLDITINQYNYLNVTDEQIEARKLFNKKTREKSKKKPYFVLIEKVTRFQMRSICTEPFTYLDVIKKFGENPKCYLTGEPIDYNNASQYQLDHIISVNKGGSSDLSNLQLALAKPNEMKRNYDLAEFISICKAIAKYNA